MKDNAFNVVIGGEAGQGLVTIGQVLTKALVRSGYHIVVTQGYMSRIRGGHNTYAIRISAEEITAPQEPIDLLVAMNHETVQIHRNEMSSRGRILVDGKPSADDRCCIGLPLKDLAPKKFENTAALGVVAAILGLDQETIAQGILELLGKKHAEDVEANRAVLAKAFQMGSQLPVPFDKLPRIPNPPPRLTMNGNEAIAIGAMSAGVKFCSFYPMSPATTISLNLAACASRMGIVVEQAEDEISAINMALGASFAGAPAIVPTSGGGFALMVEGVSLAGMTETPVVIALAQRPGPATGLPTRTEQGDLEFALYSGHGDFPRAIFAPGSIEECFHLTRKAFELAEKYQGPTFILTDQFLADSYRGVAPFDLDNLPPITVGASEFATPYKRYALTGSGVSPRLLPGQTEHLVCADSDEHVEEGKITEDLQVRVSMVQKRMKKFEGLCSEVLAPEFHGDEDPQILLVSWGSTKGSAQEAAATLRKEGKKIGTLHFAQVWPLIPSLFVERLKSAVEVVCVESNATGQFAKLIRRETGFLVRRNILRYDGLPITPEFILRALAN